MEANLSDKKSTILLVLFLLLLFTFYPLLNVGFTTNDDIQIALNSQSHYARVNLAREVAVSQGRIYGFVTMFLYYLPYYFNSFTFYKAVSLGSIILGLLAFGLTVKKIFKSGALALLSVSFYLVTLQIMWEHSLVAAYPLTFQLAFVMLLLSLLLFHNYLRNENKKIQLVSAILFFSSIIIYELFLPYFIFFPLLFYFYGKEMKPGDIWEAFFPYLALLTLYFTLYFGFRYFFPPAYEGVQVGSFSPAGYLKVLYQLSISSMPGYLFFYPNEFYNQLFHSYSSSFQGHSYSLLHLLRNLQVEWMAKAVLSGYLVLLILQLKLTLFDKKKIFKVLLVSLLLFFLPNMLIALVPKYQNWVIEHNVSAYTSTYFSFFGAALFFPSLTLYFNQLTAGKKYWPVYAGLIILLTVSISVITDYTNYHVSKSMAQSHLKWVAIDHFMETETFQSLPRGSIIYAPTLWDSMGLASLHQSAWTDYAIVFKGRDVRIINDRAVLKRLLRESREVYFLSFNQEHQQGNQYLVFSKIDHAGYLFHRGDLYSYSEDVLGDRIKLEDSITGRDYLYGSTVDFFSYSPNRQFYLFFNFEEPGSNNQVFLEDARRIEVSGDYALVLIGKEGDVRPLNHTRITSTGNIDLNSFLVSYYTGYDPLSTGIELIFAGGFYGPETGEEGAWRWGKRESRLVLINPSTEDRHIKILLEFSTGYPEPSRLTLRGENFVDQLYISSEPKVYEKELLIPGRSEMELVIISDAPPVEAPGDPRELVFRVTDYNTATLNTE